MQQKSCGTSAAHGIGMGSKPLWVAGARCCKTCNNVFLVTVTRRVASCQRIHLVALVQSLLYWLSLGHQHSKMEAIRGAPSAATLHMALASASKRCSGSVSVT